jgi:hypothetical protein
VHVVGGKGRKGRKGRKGDARKGDDAPDLHLLSLVFSFSRATYKSPSVVKKKRRRVMARGKREMYFTYYYFDRREVLLHVVLYAHRRVHRPMRAPGHRHRQLISSVMSSGNRD